MRNSIKSIFCPCLAILMLLLSIPSCGSGVKGPMTFATMPAEISVGDTLTLEVLDAKGNAIDADKLFWAVDDNRIARVSADGQLTVQGVGLLRVTAMDKNDLSNQVTTQIFCPYDISAATEMTKVVSAEDGEASGLLDNMVSTMVSTGKNVVRSMTGKISTLGIAGMMVSFFDKDKYMFTLAENRHDITNGVVYTVCDWTNQGWYFDPDDVTTQSIYQQMGASFDVSHLCGASIDDLTVAVQNAIQGKTPNDGLFHLDMLDDKYEYRVVVLADYTTVRIKDYYSNGAITGLGMTLQELLSLELSSFDDVNNNWQYHIITNEIVGLRNVRLAVEYRVKA